MSKFSYSKEGGMGAYDGDGRGEWENGRMGDVREWSSGREVGKRWDRGGGMKL